MAWLTPIRCLDRVARVRRCTYMYIIYGTREHGNKHICMVLAGAAAMLSRCDASASRSGLHSDMARACGRGNQQQTWKHRKARKIYIHRYIHIIHVWGSTRKAPTSISALPSRSCSSAPSRLLHFDRSVSAAGGVCIGGGAILDRFSCPEHPNPGRAGLFCITRHFQHSPPQN